MCQRYDMAVEIVLSYLTERGFSRTVRKEFSHAGREFAKYLDASHLTYSDAVARDWVNARKSSLSRPRFLILRRALTLIENAARNGSVSTDWFSYDDAPFRYRVPNCYGPLLAAYLEQRRQAEIGRSALQMDSRACSRFLLFLQSRNITDPAFITAEIVKDYHAQTQHRTAEGRNAYIRRVRGFIRFLASKKLVPQTLEFAFVTEKAPRVSIVTTLSGQQVHSIKVFGQTSCSPMDLRSAAMGMLALRMGLRSVDIL